MPRKATPACPTELRTRLDVINRTPRANSSEWKEFVELMKEIIQPLEEKIDRLQKHGWSDPILSSEYADCVDRFELEDKLLVDFRRHVTTRISDKFLDFALSLEEPAAWCGYKEIYREITNAKAELDAIKSLIREAQYNDGGGWIVSSAPRFIQIDEWTPSESEDFMDSIAYICRNQISIKRLNICAICDRVYWQKYSGRKRRPETCGEKVCVGALSELKRKEKKKQGRKIH